MHSSTIFSAALISFASAQDYCWGNKSAAGYCTPGEYIDRTSTAASPPSRDDCYHTCSGIQTDAGDWSVDFRGQPAGYKDLMLVYDCGFAVSRESDTDTSGFEFSMHNQDILDLIDEAVNRFADKHGGKVAAEGTMTCGDHTARWYVE
ncbi:putative necrosis-inducing factor-domain-containing protein [Xylariaceae sp. FL0662B]|nr:putative necrosis-inducing factor-domain-containing protein [Xylariaceae sp. FL0662B]